MNIYLACALSFVVGFLVAMAMLSYVDNDEYIGDVLNDDEEE